MREAPHVIDVTDPFDPRGPTLSPDGTIGFADVSYAVDELDMSDYDVAQAAVTGVRDAGVQVAYSGELAYAAADEPGGGEGVGVVIAICGLQVSGIPAIGIMGYSSAIVVAVAMVLAVTLLPALLGLAGTKIDKLRLPRLRRRAGRAAHARHGHHARPAHISQPGRAATVTTAVRLTPTPRRSRDGGPTTSAGIRGAT